MSIINSLKNSFQNQIDDRLSKKSFIRALFSTIEWVELLVLDEIENIIENYIFVLDKIYCCIDCIPIIGYFV